MNGKHEQHSDDKQRRYTANMQASRKRAIRQQVTKQNSTTKESERPRDAVVTPGHCLLAG